MPRLLIFLFVGLSTQALFAEEIVSQKPGIAQEITAIITAKQHPYLMLSNFPNRTEDLESLYTMSNHQLLWLGTANAEKSITDALNLLAHAPDHGLKSKNYDTETLRQKLPSALTLKPDDYKELALYDTALSISLLRFLHDLHYGRVNPQGINFNLKLREKKLIDLPLLIKNSLTQNTLAELPQSVEPKFKQYQKLKQALAHYRELAVTTPPFKLSIEKTLRPGESHPQIAELRRFLVAIGDLPDDKADVSAEKSSLYTDAIASGVKRFQKRHGLTADGQIGKGSAAVLSVHLSQRVTQIELAMERLRWLPEFNGSASVIVNIPAFQLWALDAIDQPDANIINMKVVVGNALKTQTPVLMAEMHFIDFMPYWNVPYSIIKNEILPKLIQNGNYLEKENMEMVSVLRDGAKPAGLNIETMNLLKEGKLRIRQRPGRKNALGRVKFIFPNKEDVYLHDTPANALFSKSRRDFSHGCVRVENPQKLAEFALKNQDNWNPETIQLAMSAPKTQRVILKKPIPVLFFYTTAFFDQFDNLEFYLDIYGHDAVLLEALSKPDDLSDQSLFISTNSTAPEAAAKAIK
ncbi:MAG: L,D-transpeptidase family protein [Methylobacter sp.]|jgi:murein L,D-transpeptidase YcbB/YkuD|uniref:L,D-transpeptidase family protein n=1 Tax=Methylobacter sp. TaxID=2051955 RepID=UPI0025D324BC|nr:L,D-transpeptidase family protein [Methylobacter sp.]MCK9621104.1 L,D-transpeptidase family protein [Methylobacter sp.]